MKLFLNPNIGSDGLQEAPRGFTLCKNSKEVLDALQKERIEQLTMSSLDDGAHFVLRWLSHYPEHKPLTIANTLSLTWGVNKKNDDFNTKVETMYKGAHND